MTCKVPACVDVWAYCGVCLRCCSIPVEQLAGSNFWIDLCRSKNGIIYSYHMANASITKKSFVEGMSEFIGPKNGVVNDAVLSLCKKFPLSLLAYSKAHFLNYQAGDLYNLKSRIVHNVAENIVRYD